MKELGELKDMLAIFEVQVEKKSELNSPIRALTTATTAADDFVRKAKQAIYRAENMEVSDAEVPKHKELMLGTSTTCETHRQGAKQMKTATSHCFE